MRHLTIPLILILIAAPVLADDVPSGEIAGTVTNADGQPIEGALVDAWTWYAGNETKTDKDGHFHLKKLDTHRKIELRISKDGFSPWYAPQQPSGVGDLNVTLSNKTYFEGTVYSPDGKPVPHALIRYDCGPKLADDHLHIVNVWTETKSDDAGHYKLYVAPDSYLIQTRIPDIGVARVRASIDPDQAISQDIQLEPGVRFVINCIDADTSKGVPDVKLTVDRQKGIQAVTDANGQAVFEHMPADDFEFSVSSKAYVKWWSTDAINEEMRQRPQNLALRWESIKFKVGPDTQPATIQLEQGITISGHVFDPSGQPVVGATIATAKYAWGDSIDSTKRFTAHTSAEGAFNIVLPASGNDSYCLIAHDGNYDKWRTWANGVTEPMYTTPGQNKDNVIIKLTTPATIKGQVVDSGGNPIANKWVRVMSADDCDSRYLAPEAHTDQDGNFEIKFVRPGDVLAQIEPFFMKDDNGRSPAINGVQVNVGENETKEGVRITASP